MRVIPTHGALLKMWVDGVPVDPKAEQQLRNAAELPFIYKWIAVMPDVHFGIGATVGSVIPTKGAIIPAAVGVDIGCGMVARRTTMKAHDLPALFKVRQEIERVVPVGRTNNGGAGDRGSWHNVPDRIAVDFQKDMEPGLNMILEKHPKIKSRVSPAHQYGTLGSGNHFIEVCTDQNEHVWIVLHSGSRGIGNKIGTYFIEKAREDMRTHFINLPDRDLAYLPEGTQHFEDYWQALNWAQWYAKRNREIMMERIIFALTNLEGMPLFDFIPVEQQQAINCHHNYVAIENHYGENVYVTRKGAVRARNGDLGIIPGSMGARSYIVRGKGNPQSFNSCSHGAGRVMSRSEAKRVFTVEQHEAATAGVECRKDEGVLDETPGAYKDIDAVMEAQQDLVEVLYTLKQIVCVKG